MVVDCSEEAEETVSGDLVAFLRARLDEDDRAALDVSWDDDDSRRWTAYHRKYDDRWVLIDGMDEGVEVHSTAADAGAVVRHAARHDPARVLRDVEAKRRVVELHYAELVEVINADGDERSGYWCAECDGAPFPCRTLRLLAWAYADHQDYRPEWAPDDLLEVPR